MTDDIINKLLESDIDARILLYVSSNTFNKLISYPKFQTVFQQLSIDQINSLLLIGDTLPVNKDLDNDIIFKFLQIDDINKYRTYILNLQANNSFLADIIDSKRNDNYDSMINSLDKKTGLLKDYNDLYNIFNNGDFNFNMNKELERVFYKIRLFDKSNDRFNAIKEFANKKLLEIIVD